MSGILCGLIMSTMLIVLSFAMQFIMPLMDWDVLIVGIALGAWSVIAAIMAI